MPRLELMPCPMSSVGQGPAPSAGIQIETTSSQGVTGSEVMNPSVVR